MPVWVHQGIKTSKFGYITKYIDLHLAIMETINAIDYIMLQMFSQKIQLLWGHKKDSSRKHHH